MDVDLAITQFAERFETQYKHTSILIHRAVKFD